MGIRIRAVTEDDAAAIVALLKPIIEAGCYTIMAEPVSVEQQMQFIQRLPERAIYHGAICEESGRVLGVQDVLPASSEPALEHVGEISTFVSLDSLHRGIGRSLCRATFERAREQGFRKLVATIRADNPRAVSFYRREGFELIGRAREHAFVRGTYVDEILLERLDTEQTL